MADFHEYYSGARVAPYLTVFIGGNHEASNHLFELYYGGWVAPNIYYLGAANVLRFGPLRIGGLSGIWKPYDYNKSHFERLPYSERDIGSIYHVRSLDVRKLLAVRSQIDIGLSHDWPQGIEMLGDHQWLFQAKRGFQSDSISGRLGSVAARYCLEYLRPPYWFSAHLHTKYAAIMHHGGENPPGGSTALENKPLSKTNAPKHDTGNIDQIRHQNEISAWQQFHLGAQKADVEERDQKLRERDNRRIEQEQTGVHRGPQYVFEETFNQVAPGDDMARNVISTTLNQVDHNLQESEELSTIPQADGCASSRPSKKQRLHSPSPQGDEPSADRPTASDTSNGQVTHSASSAGIIRPQATVNPDAIDIEMSDDDEEEEVVDNPVVTVNAGNAGVASSQARGEPTVRLAAVDQNKTMNDSSYESEDGGVVLNPKASSFAPRPAATVLPEKADSPPPSRASAGSDLHPQAKAFEPPVAVKTANHLDPTQQPSSASLPGLTRDGNAKAESEVSEEMRAQLAALSGTFTQREEVTTSAPLPYPEAITNKTTQFLALGKCEPFQEFLQLLEVKSITDPEASSLVRPLKLAYDPEWLAIQRVFASELSLGGHPNDRSPPHRGDTYYREEILRESEWISEHVVKTGKLDVPVNFTITAPVYDPKLEVQPHEMPREVSNPQTQVYCDLIGIENKFDISEEERDARIQQGPRPVDDDRGAARDRRDGDGHRGRGGGGGRGGRGRGGFGHRGGGRGRGQGRGRGPGRYH